METLKYLDVFEDSFLQKFGDKEANIGKLELSEESGFEIDVKKIANICGINVEETVIEDSGQYDADKKVILVNIFEPENRQRFTVAHELGHAILGHEGVSYRADLNKYEDLIKRNKEIVANNFAANLLMPKQLILNLILNIVNDEKWDKSRLDQSQFDSIIENLAKKLNVSEIALNYRIKNLGIFGKA